MFINTQKAHTVCISLTLFVRRLTPQAGYLGLIPIAHTAISSSSSTCNPATWGDEEVGMELATQVLLTWSS